MDLRFWHQTFINEVAKTWYVARSLWFIWRARRIINKDRWLAVCYRDISDHFSQKADGIISYGSMDYEEARALYEREKLVKKQRGSGRWK